MDTEFCCSGPNRSYGAPFSADQAEISPFDFVKPDSKAAKFCIGRTVRDLPLGLIILAARNQYNHWDDPEPHTLTVEVFNRIANHSGKYTDPAFDIRNASLNMYSHNIISLVQWTNYDAYHEDISNLLLS